MGLPRVFVLNSNDWSDSIAEYVLHLALLVFLSALFRNLGVDDLPVQLAYTRTGSSGGTRFLA
jgi:hypothetical protein